MSVDRKTRELIRKRRNNLLRRHDEFAERYGMTIWLTMKMPSGRLYTYRSHPDLPAPTEEEMRHWQPAVIHKTPGDYRRRGGRRLSKSVSPSPSLAPEDRPLDARRQDDATPCVPGPSDVVTTALHASFHQWPRLRLLKLDVGRLPQQ